MKGEGEDDGEDERRERKVDKHKRIMKYNKMRGIHDMYIVFSRNNTEEQRNNGYMSRQQNLDHLLKRLISIIRI